MRLTVLCCFHWRCNHHDVDVDDDDDDERKPNRNLLFVAAYADCDNCLLLTALLLPLLLPSFDCCNARYEG